jgi:hypothetical protein
MKTTTNFGALAGSLLLVLAAGCSKSGPQSQQALDPAKVPTVINQAFQAAPDDSKQQAAAFVTTFQGQDAPKAFEQLRKLSQQSNLSADQRTAVAQAMQTTFRQLQAAAQNGDAAAKAAVHQYLSTR